MSPETLVSPTSPDATCRRTSPETLFAVTDDSASRSRRSPETVRAAVLPPTRPISTSPDHVPAARRIAQLGARGRERLRVAAIELDVRLLPVDVLDVDRALRHRQVKRQRAGGLEGLLDHGCAPLRQSSGGRAARRARAAR